MNFTLVKALTFTKKKEVLFITGKQFSFTLLKKGRFSVYSEFQKRQLQLSQSEL